MDRGNALQQELDHLQEGVGGLLREGQLTGDLPLQAHTQTLILHRQIYATRHIVITICMFEWTWLHVSYTLIDICFSLFNMANLADIRAARSAAIRSALSCPGRILSL